jgi:hypothetical protein
VLRSSDFARDRKLAELVNIERFLLGCNVLVVVIVVMTVLLNKLFV